MGNSRTEIDLPPPDESGDPSMTIWPKGSFRALMASGEFSIRGVAETAPRPPDSVPSAQSAAEMAATAAVPSPDPLPATSPAIPYEQTGFVFGDMIGQGGMGEVFRATQQSLQRTVAVKTIRDDTWASSRGDDEARDAMRSEFVREALVTARLEHPNIAPVHELTFTGPGRRPHLAMKLVRGESWTVLLHRDRSELSEADYLARHLPILERMAQAVAFAHSRGIMHRDLKPGQVMVGDFGETVLMDWGLALQFGDPPDESGDVRIRGTIPTLDSASNPAGTPCMMAPEQTTKATDQLGPHTDVYLLGGTLYFILTGYYPHDAPTPGAAMMRAASGLIVPPKLRNPERWIPDELAQLAIHALAADPADRIPSADAFISALRDYLTGSGRRRESETLLRQAIELANEPTDALSTAQTYARHAAIAERLSRALELWSDNQGAIEQKGISLAARIRTEIAAGDLLLAETHLEELTLMCEAYPSLPVDLQSLAAALAQERFRRARQQRQRSIFAWAATLLLLGHAIGATLWLIRSQDFSNRMSEQKKEISLRTDREIRNLSMELGNSLLASGRPAEAMEHFARALTLSQIINGTGSEMGNQAAKGMEEAGRMINAAPRAPSD